MTIKKSVPAWQDRPVASARFGATVVLTKRMRQKAHCLAAWYAAGIFIRKTGGFAKKRA
jgi:hypothetical protein